MSLTITCPVCQRSLRVPESLLGQAVKCPSCSHRFTAAEQSEDEAPPPSTSSAVRTTRRPVAPPVDEEDAAPRRTERISDRPQPRRARQDDEDRPPRPRDDDYDDYEERKPSKSDRKASWNKVRIGINLVMIGIWVWLGGTILGALGGVLSVLLLGSSILSSASSGQANWTSFGFAGILFLLSLGIYYLALFVELVLRLVGYGLCMAAPAVRDSGLRPLAITAFAAGAAHAFLSFVNLFFSGFTGFATSLNNRNNLNAAGTAIGLLSGLCAIASFIVFLFFLRSVCNNIRARELASKPIAVLVAFILFWVLTVMMIVIVSCAGGAFTASALQSQSGNRAASSLASSLGTWFIIMIVLAGIAGFVYMGLQVWYILVLQKIRDAVASYRRRL
jgi:predicted Zn finger-like uncharacterized protein